MKESKDVVGESSKDYNLLSLTKSGIIPRDVASGKGKFPSDFSTYKIICPGDMVFCLFDIDETPRTVGLSSHHGMLTGAYDVFHVTAISSKYMLYYYLALDDVKAMRPLYKGLRKTINVDTFLGTKLPVPPRDEQDQIVRYLDWQVSKINRLISAKRKEIDLTREYLSVKIEDAFNSVIGTSSVMLPLGRYIRKIESGTSVNSIMGSANAGAPGVLSTSCVYGNCFNASQNKQVAPIDYERVSCPVRKDTVIVSRMNTPSLVGACGYSDKDIDNVFLPDRLWQVYFNDTLMPEFVWRYLSRQSVQSWFATIATGSSNTMKNITKLQFKTVLIPNIDLEKQKRVTEIIRKIMDKRNTSCQLYEKTISNLQDLRTRLISDVVTGQIDVRSIKVPDYELVDEVVHDSEDEEPEVE